MVRHRPCPTSHRQPCREVDFALTQLSQSLLCGRTLLMVVFATVLSNPASADPAVTFSKDIAPIVFTKCTMCHHPGGAAPFSLVAYATARSHATQIAEATGSGLMPPWKAKHGV